MNNLVNSPTPETICFGPACNFLNGKATNGSVLGAVGGVFGTLLMLVISGSTIFTLVYLIWGAFDWIISNGEKERIGKAMAKMRTAVMGIMLLIISLTIFGIVSGDILGLVKKTPNGWIFVLPQLFGGEATPPPVIPPSIPGP